MLAWDFYNLILFLFKICLRRIFWCVGSCGHSWWLGDEKKNVKLHNPFLFLLTIALTTKLQSYPTPSQSTHMLLRVSFLGNTMSHKLLNESRMVAIQRGQTSLIHSLFSHPFLPANVVTGFVNIEIKDEGCSH